MSFNWNDPIFRTSDYWKWEKPGDTITGTITDVGTHTFDAKTMPDGTQSAAKTVPVITVDDPTNGTTEVTCSNADLLEQVRAVAPQIGDRIEMTYLREIPTSFGGKKKIFSVKHAKGQGAPEAPVEQIPGQESAPFSSPTP